MTLRGNAAECTDEGEVRLRVGGEDGRVVCEVRDSGVGIAPEHQPPVFDRIGGWTAPRPARSGGWGSGWRRRGSSAGCGEDDVEVESGHGRGSTFRVRLPRRNEKASRT